MTETFICRFHCWCVKTVTSAQHRTQNSMSTWLPRLISFCWMCCFKMETVCRLFLFNVVDPRKSGRCLVWQPMGTFINNKQQTDWCQYRSLKMCDIIHMAGRHPYLLDVLDTKLAFCLFSTGKSHRAGLKLAVMSSSVTGEMLAC